MRKLVLDRLGWMLIGIAVYLLITAAVNAVEYHLMSPYEKEALAYAQEIPDIERQHEHLQNMTFQDKLAFDCYAATLRTHTRAHLHKMGALRILERGY